MEKVKLTRIQANALEEALKSGYDIDTLMDICANEDPEEWSDDCKPFASMRIAKIARALYVGYEVEETPEEKVLAYYLEQKKLLVKDQIPTEIAIRDILKMLSIKIEGVNA